MRKMAQTPVMEIGRRQALTPQPDEEVPGTFSPLETFV